MTMFELHQEKTIALPFGSLITKILKAKLPSIPPSELVEIPEDCSGKAAVMKSNAQLQRFHMVDEPAPPAPSTSRPSNANLLLQLNHITKMLQPIDRCVECIDQRVGIIETDMEQVPIHVQTTLCIILPKDQRDQVP